MSRIIKTESFLLWSPRSSVTTYQYLNDMFTSGSCQLLISAVFCETVFFLLKTTVIVELTNRVLRRWCAHGRVARSIGVVCVQPTSVCSRPMHCRCRCSLSNAPAYDPESFPPEYHQVTFRVDWFWPKPFSFLRVIYKLGRNKSLLTVSSSHQNQMKKIEENLPKKQIIFLFAIF